MVRTFNIKGTSTDALPVDVKITYYLNDKQVTADELKGQKYSQNPF